MYLLFPREWKILSAPSLSAASSSQPLDRTARLLSVTLCFSPASSLEPSSMWTTCICFLPVFLPEMSFSFSVAFITPFSLNPGPLLFLFLMTHSVESFLSCCHFYNLYNNFFTFISTFTVSFSWLLLLGFYVTDIKQSRNVKTKECGY